MLKRAHELTGRRRVVLMDEYDKPILDVLDSQQHLHVTTIRHARGITEGELHRDFGEDICQPGEANGMTGEDAASG